MHYFTVAGLRGALPARAPPAQNVCNFMQFFGKCWQYRRFAPLSGGLAPPPTGNPGSAPVLRFISETEFIGNLFPMSLFPFIAQWKFD